jgi:two-component system NtrC family sensor kinase
MGILSTIPEKCRRCYTCVRECPAKAIKVERGQALVIEERCIACGNCVKVCAQKAKRIADSSAEVEAMLTGDERVVACLAPSFPAAFHPLRPGQVIAAVKALGFDEVWEVAFGAELVSRAYARLFRAARERGERVITTPCPAIIGYVSKFMPSLRGALAPLVSPMIAAGRAVRRRCGSAVRVVFIGPCIAKKGEVLDPPVAGTIDAALTYEELRQMFDRAGLAPERLCERRFDGPRCRLARSFPISGGLLKTAGLSTDILENDIVVTEGKGRVLEALRELDAGQSAAHLFDVLFCEGCINGPKMLNDLSVFARKEIVADFVREEAQQTSAEESERALAEFADLDLSRSFVAQDLTLPRPDEAQIAAALAAMKKQSIEDQLNCGACGYETCRDKAVAVCQGLAEPAMCLPYLVEELEAACANLQQSKEDLEAAQNRLVLSERLASMGQLSAAVAHEINNPLGTILIFSHMLLRQLRREDPQQADLEMIVSEATRCKNIVRGLLDFARQSRVSKSATRLAGLVNEVLAIQTPKAEAAGVRLSADVDPDLPVLWIDAMQIKQMLVNLVQNGIDATPPGGAVRVTARLGRGGAAVELRVADTGCGIPRENLPKLFTPFFSTKAAGKGTGLGLAIVYGIVKMHSGDIAAESQEGRGSTFVVSLPVGSEEPKEWSGPDGRPTERVSGRGSLTVVSAGLPPGPSAFKETLNERQEEGPPRR